MESGTANRGNGVPENLKQQLAIAVRSIQWSYGIFWSISPSQPGMLEWGDGYYNGDIKTRKTVQAVEFNADELGLQRSEQLRELYESLSAGESSGQIRRPSAALSPEDLTDTEWYYLVCMSFHFDIGQGLPGRTLATGQPIWLCDAPYADSKTFSRSLLAKTVVCFPFFGGVVELGVTDMVPENPAPIQHVKASLLETPHWKYSMKFHHDNFETRMIPIAGELEMVSPTSSSNAFEAHQLPDESQMVEGINGAASQVHSWQFMDDDFSNCLQHSVNSSDCVSQSLIDPGNVIEYPLQEDERKGGNHDRLGVDVRDDDFHYQSILSSLLKTSKELIFGPSLPKGKRESSFRTWKKGGSANSGKLSSGTNQRLLKSILFEVPHMHDEGLREYQMESSCMKNGVCRPEADEIGQNHVLAERRRRERIHEQFGTLKSIVPSVNKFDKVSVLDDTIEYLKQLVRRVEELECTVSEENHRRKLPQDTSERTCDNYGENKLGIGKRHSVSKRPSVSKRKAQEMDETGTEINCTENLIVTVEDKEVVIEMKCKWREGLLLEVINAASNLRLDSHSVQTSTADGILSLAMRSKFVGSASPSAQTIRQALQRFAWRQR
ncbi:hypothetical protein CDL15_Pgr017928 [Punica granatum]|uniref:BHLH domain-containing protein n=1 Tax=Punica granatum TaxID=22663 RepID=A0A218WGV1_PUNGR|nr:hypothetical protein CDL15_Pgr017928 [Punica granatum]